MKQFIIHKVTNAPDHVNGTPKGPIWKRAKSLHKYKKFYTNKMEALLIAFYLNQFSKFGFEVSERIVEE